MALYVIDVAAALFALAGFYVAFRPKLARAWSQRLRKASDQPGTVRQTDVSLDDPEGVDSVLRIIGVMIMAFSITGAVFANLIAYYASAGTF